MTEGREAVATVVVRNENDGRGRRILTVWLDTQGDLHVDGHDLGPGTEMVSHDGEYEWFETIRAQHVPALLEALDPDAVDIIDAVTRLSQRPLGSYHLEEVLRTGVVPLERFVW